MHLSPSEIAGTFEFGPGCLVSAACWDQVGLEAIAAAILGACCLTELDAPGLAAAASIAAGFPHVYVRDHSEPQGAAEGAVVDVQYRTAIWTGRSPLPSPAGTLFSLVAMAWEWAKCPRWGALHVAPEEIEEYGLQDRYREVREAVRRQLRT